MDFLVEKHNIFQNPQNVPLNELNITLKYVKPEKLQRGKPVKAKTSKFPAIHTAFIDERSFPQYQAYYDYAENYDEMIETFIAKGKTYIDALNFLLSCNYQQFWCYITKVPSVVRMLKHFIYKFTPVYELDAMDANCLDCYSEIHQKVATIWCRILTYTHSPSEFMSESTVLRLLEESQMLSFPIFMNLSVLYNESCPDLVDELARLYFDGSRVTKWENEVQKMLDQVSLVFEMLGGQICGFRDDSMLIPIGIPPKPPHFDPSWYEDFVTFFLDTLTSLNALIHRCEYIKIKALDMGIPYRLTYFYNEVFPGIYKVMEYKRTLPYDWSKIKERIFDRIAKGRRECVTCFNLFVTYIIDNIVKNQNNNVEQDKHLETYITLITAAMEHELFIFDYHNSNHIGLQLQLITDFYPELDTMRTNYIMECLTTLPKLENIIRNKEAVERQAHQEEYKMFARPSCSTSSKVPPQPHRPPTDDEIDASIQIVAETLPDLGDGFIYKCLEFYNNDPAEVITALLEENLPPNLDDIPRDTIRVPPEPAPEQPILAYRGKKPQPKDAKEVLDDKSDMHQVKDFILNKSAMTYDVYDDEYDDRDDYDPMPRKLGKRDEPEEEDPYHYMENRFEGYQLVSDPSDSEGDDKGKAAQASGSGTAGGRGGGSGTFKAFCDDPAKLREQREMARRNFRGRGGGRDLVGKPKGQGQDQQVVNNRDKKTVNKSSRGNHSRKTGAQWKKSRGMY